MDQAYASTIVDITVIFPDDAGLWESPTEDLLELGESFEANARRKAEHFAKLSGRPTVADDSGLEVFSLVERPGCAPAVGPGATGTPEQADAANNAELLRRLLGAPEARRRARYRCVLVYLSEPEAVPRVFEGVCGGRILEEPRGQGGFGYDPLFFSDELGRTFGEATAEEKDAVSHRGRAVRAFAEAVRHG